MGQELGKINAQTQREIVGVEAQLQRLTSSKEWELARGAVDAAGIVDPTPISDGIGMVMSLAAGDWMGAALSAVSMVPYLGDAVAKTAKGARAIAKLKELTEAITGLTKRLDGLKSVSKEIDDRKEAARRVREQRKEAANACKKCDAETKYGSHLPAKGKWDGERGNSKWTSEDGSITVPYKDGYPDFAKATGPGGTPVVMDAVEIPGMKGDRSDFTSARDEIRKKTGDPGWPTKPEEPGATRSRNAPAGYTWHHSEDGATMQLVRSDVHNATQGGRSHTGGVSVVKDERF